MIPIVTALLPIVGEVIDRVVPDTAGRDKAKAELERTLAEAAMKGQLGQIEINKVEAASRSLFVAGWRPCCGWVCALSFGMFYLGFPLAQWIGRLTGHDVPIPDLDMDSLLYVLGAMLGIGGLRTYEKQKGLTR